MSDPEPTASTGDEVLVSYPMAPMDSSVAARTVLVLVALVGGTALALMGAYALARGFHWAVLVGGLVAALSVAAIIVLIRLYARPIRLDITTQGLEIVWAMRTRKLPRAACTEIQVIHATQLGRIRRRFGVGLLFGVFGWYISEYLGNVDVYMTRWNDIVFLRLMNRRSVLLTPADPEGFMNQLHRVIHSSGR